MSDPSSPIQLDIFHLAFIMLGLGLLAYALIRKTNPLIRWHEHGNVWTEPFLKVDLAVLALIIGSYYMMIRSAVNSTNLPTTLNENTIIAGILSQIAFSTILIGGIVFLLAYVRRVDVMELFGLSRLPPLKVILWAVSILAITFPIVILATFGWMQLLEHAFGQKPPSQAMVEIMKESNSTPLKLMIAFSAVIFAPISEEILFRGYFYPALKRHSERLFAAIIISLLFAVVHSNTMSILPLFILAMSFTIAYELTGCLLVPIVMHAIFNAVQVFLMLNYVPDA